jgi:hypothetical protein
MFGSEFGRTPFAQGDISDPGSSAFNGFGRRRRSRRRAVSRLRHSPKTGIKSDADAALSVLLQIARAVVSRFDREPIVVLRDVTFVLLKPSAFDATTHPRIRDIAHGDTRHLILRFFAKCAWD